LPRPIRLQLMPAIGARLPERTDIPTDRNVVTAIRRLAQASSTSHKASILAWGSFFTEEQKAALWHAPDRATSPTSVRLAALYDAAPADNHLDRTLYADFVGYLQDDLLVKADRMSMAHSLETRAPFLDHDVLDTALHAPVRMRVRGLSQKVVLREAFADVLPPDNVKRVKRGFGMPVASWLRGQLGDTVRDVLLDPHTLGRGYFRPDAVERLLTEHQSGQFDHGQRLWALLVLELWHRQVIDVPTPTVVTL
jgi:asparagine synthase (glutamine-hydrolysing)